MIVRHFAEVCLQRWGVSLDKTLNLDGLQLLELHQAIQRNAGQFARCKKRCTPFLRTIRGSVTFLWAAPENRSHPCRARFSPDQGWHRII
jgi:hypothetical protein